MPAKTLTQFAKDFFAYLNLASLLLLVGSLPFGYQNREIFITAFYATFVLEYLFNARFRSFHFDKTKRYYVWVILFAILFFFYLPFESDKALTSDIFGIKRLHLIIWAVIGLLGFNEKFKFKYIPLSIIIGAMFAIFYIVFWKIGLIDFVKNSERATVFSLTRIEFVGTHMIFNFYLNLALISIIYLFYNYSRKIHFVLKTLLCLCGEIFFFFLMITEGRSGFLFALFIVFFMFCVFIYQRNKSLALLVFVNIPIMVLLFSTQHTRINKSNMKGEARLFLWGIASPIIKEKPLLGHGANQSIVNFNQARLEQQSEHLADMWKEEKYVDTHNQYLHTWMEAGLIGLLLLLGIYILPWFLAAPEERIFLLFFIPLSLFQSLFDNFLTGQAFGITFLLLVVAIDHERHRNVLEKSST